MTDHKDKAHLDAEGDAAADFLEELLDILDMDGDIDISVEAGRAKVAIVAEGPSQDMRRLVGQDGEVLDALQDLARLAVQSETGDMSRLMLDIADFRAGRRERLAESAREAVAKVKESGKKLALDSMNAFERKVVHDVVLEAGLKSESEGEDPDRYVVILPADE
jgi:spoIIIJ-associated protein